jgi:hypothetical protein
MAQEVAMFLIKYSYTRVEYDDPGVEVKVVFITAEQNTPAYCEKLHD